MQYKTTMTAVMEPDVYSSNPMEPQWRCSCDGDMGDEVGLRLIELAASTFPAGTMVEIRVPLCPDCGMESSHTIENCECGFDWSAWAEHNFS